MREWEYRLRMEWKERIETMELGIQVPIWDHHIELREDDGLPDSFEYC